jgi:hypothetical protein
VAPVDAVPGEAVAHFDPVARDDVAGAVEAVASAEAPAASGIDNGVEPHNGAGFSETASHESAADLPVARAVGEEISR